MEDWVWTFGRANQRLTIRRKAQSDGLLLVVSGDGPARSYFFNHLVPLVEFQADMEAFLLKTGWSFVEFSPDRRTGHDRRTFPRVSERRRWWTDGSAGAATPERPRSSPRRSRKTR